MSTFTKLITLMMTVSMLLSNALHKAAPQHDPDGLLFLVNRQYTVSSAFVPSSLEMSDVPGQVRRMRPDAAAALREMFQAGIYAHTLRSVKKDEAKAQEYVAPPGASEHQSGLAMDIGQKHKIHLEESFRDTAGGIWCRENCWRFGFILRYDEGWEDITGYKFEPWHFRYVGKEYAKEIHEANIPLETWLISHRAEVLRQLIEGPADLPAESPATPTELGED